MSKLKVLFFKTGCWPEVLEIENELAEYQKLVSGWIEVVRQTVLVPSKETTGFTGVDFVIVVNEEGRLKGLPVNRTWPSSGEPILGDFFVCRPGNEDGFGSLSDEDVLLVKRMFL